MDALGLDTKNVRPWHQLSMLLVTLHYTTSSNSWSFQYQQTPRHCDCKIIIATFPSFQYRDRLEGGETNIQVVYGLILQVECQLFPFSGSCELFPSGAIKTWSKPDTAQFLSSLPIHCMFPGHSLLCCLPRHVTYTIRNKNPMEVDLIFKENLAMSKYSSPCLFLEERLWGETPGGWLQLTALSGRISLPKLSWGIDALKTSPVALPQK